MKKTKYLATTVGVIMVVAVIVISTTLWLQRPAGQPREDLEDAKDGTADIRKLTGTLLITPSWDGGDYDVKTNYWLYINSQIMATKPSPRDDPSSLQPFEILLVPGEYTLEVAIPAPFAEGVHNFPFNFRAQKIIVEPGKIRRIEVDVGYLMNTRTNVRSTRLIDGDMTWEEWYDKAVEKVNEWIKEYQQDQTFLAINDVFIALQQSPPLSPVVYVNLPEHYGGGREYNARQIRKIVTWLRRKSLSWGWSLDSSFRDSMPTTIRQKYEQLETQVSQHEDSIERFNNIAEKLEQVEKAERAIIAVTGALLIRKSSEVVAAEPTSSIRKLTGTLSITLTNEADAQRPNSYWIYVNGHIIERNLGGWNNIFSRIKNKPLVGKFEILLVPGEYTVEVAASRAHLNNEIRFPFIFISQKVKIEAGKLTEIKFNNVEFIPTYLPPQWITRGKNVQELRRDFKSRKTWEDMLEVWFETFNYTLKHYPNDPTFIAIHNVYTTFQQSPPLYSRVYIDMPEIYGGGREYDGAQIRKLVWWLKEAGCGSSYHLVETIPLQYRESYERLSDQVSNLRDSFDIYNKIAEKLEKVNDIAEKLEQVEKAKRYGSTELRKRIGTLSITLTHDDLTDYNSYWVYVNGSIVERKLDRFWSYGNLLDKFEILLVPGEYTVEVAVSKPVESNDDKFFDENFFPFTFISQKVKIETGKLTEVKFNVRHKSTYGPPRWIYRGKTVQELAIEAGRVYTWEDFLKEWVEELNYTLKHLPKDPTWLAINDVYVALQQSPPFRPIVYIDMPEKYGGGRQYDGYQVRLIVWWLKEVCCGFFPFKNIDEIPAPYRERYKQISSQISSLRDSIGIFNQIAEKLEEAKKANR